MLDPHRFKEHKRCSYMIANALDADNKFTAVQVSRKLKQLGLTYQIGCVDCSCNLQKRRKQIENQKRDREGGNRF